MASDSLTYGGEKKVLAGRMTQTADTGMAAGVTEDRGRVWPR